MGFGFMPYDGRIAFFFLHDDKWFLFDSNDFLIFEWKFDKCGL